MINKDTTLLEEEPDSNVAPGIEDLGVHTRHEGPISRNLHNVFHSFFFILLLIIINKFLLFLFLYGR